MLRFLFRSGLFLIGFAAGFVLPWVWYLNQLIDDRFELTVADQPSQIFARPLQIREGQVLKPEQLSVELAAARYSRGEADRPGRYQRDAAAWRIYSRDFSFPDGHQHGRGISFRLDQNRVRELRDANGRPLSAIRLDPARIGSLYGDNEAERQPLPLAQMPPVLIQGLQAVEDRNFPHHFGIDPRGILRALWVNLTTERQQGASTLTQQLVRFTLLSRAQTLERKLKEIGLALLLEQRYSKAEILDAYLNRAILGQNGSRAVQGFPAAAEFWFARPLGELDTGELALLIGMLKATSDFNPRRRAEAATQRRNVVLNVFRDTGLIAADAAERFKAAPLGVVPTPPPSRSRHPGYLELVQRELRQIADEGSLKRAGLSILTALDPWAQHLAERSLRDTLQQLDRDGTVQGAVVVSRATDGRIVAAVPGRQTREVGFNRLVDARRPVGSLLKPFVYLLALNRPQRYGLPTMLLDAPFEYPIAGSAPWRPKNYDGRARGPVALVDALSQSLNLATARLGLEIGVDQLAGLMSAYGVPVPAPVRPSLILGSIDLSPLQVATLYQALAAGGQPMHLSTVDAVLLPDGKLYALPAVAAPRPPDRPMGLLLLAMNETTLRGTASGVSRAVQIDSAGKTGTTDGQRDSWYAGFTGEHLAVVWMGRDDNERTRFTGASGALRVWTAIFRELPSAPLRTRIGEDYRWGWFAGDSSCSSGRWMPYIDAVPPASHDCSSVQIGGY
ncbi:MAG: transglycosylase domain-containing protein [Xanthomonadales bacterium]|jgi:penicillin-binding protein 1B|nr:transglycosylase domain-containing protein [Xanthomonadales bacterium]